MLIDKKGNGTHLQELYIAPHLDQDSVTVQQFQNRSTFCTTVRSRAETR